MHLFGSKSWRRQGLALVSALSLLLITAVALAAGRIEWGSKTLKPRSDNNSWNVDIAIFMAAPPNVPSVPMKFVFQQLVKYERSILDGDKHVEQKIPIQDAQPIIESVDVGFLDPLSGSIQKRTKFSFKLHRDHGFDCGEWKVTVRDTRNDQVVGQPTTLIFGGQNEEVDRRSIVFSGEKKKEKKEAKVDADVPDSEKEKTKEKKAADDAASNQASEPGSSLDVPPADENPVEDAEVKKKPGGCGCSVPGQSRNEAPWGLLFAATALFVGRRYTSKRA